MMEVGWCMLPLIQVLADMEVKIFLVAVFHKVNFTTSRAY